MSAGTAGRSGVTAAGAVRGRLSLVATPIGNLGDITLRAIETLRAADLVYAEDTRRTRVLLAHLGIMTKLLSLHEHNERSRVDELAAALEAGRHVALVTDAGMPSISDPGALVVAEIAARGLAVEVVPGPSALTAAMALSGIPAQRFAFEGFLPAKAGERRRRLEALAGDDRVLVFFEAPHRIVALLEAMLPILGDRPAAIARELTKKHEEVRRGTLASLLQGFAAEAPRGEMTVVVAGAAGGAHAAGGVAAGERPSDDALREEVSELMASRGLSRRDAMREVATRHGLDRQSLYRLFA